jgi:hypothetical protein
MGADFVADDLALNMPVHWALSDVLLCEGTDQPESMIASVRLHSIERRKIVCALKTWRNAPNL